MQVGGFYAVEPKRDCPHILTLEFSDSLKDCSLDSAKAFYENQCAHCDVTDENWICFTCGSLECSRYKNSHMKQHNDETQHPLAISLSDLSTWCYSCEAYITSPAIRAIHSMLYLAKFGELPAKFASTLDLPEISKTGATYPPPTPIHIDLPEDTNNPNATGHLKKESIQEYKDEDIVLEAKIEELAQLVKASSKVVIFTGAGISTSANIPDYRGPNGVWTKRDRGEATSSKGLNIAEAQPTYAHRAIKAMFDMPGKDCFAISTNIDGLHMKSGLTPENLAELHGNVFQEVCCVCKKLETRETVVTSNRVPIDSSTLKGLEYDRSRLSHATGRKCDCGGYFCDNIINFGEDLPQEEIRRAVEKSTNAELSIVLGTSMRVSPANQLPSLSLQKGGKLVIVNLQNTPFDSDCAVRIWARTDEVFTRLLDKLGASVE